MYKVGVTGGAGFIGSHLVDALIEKGHKVVIIDNLSTGNKKDIHPQANFQNIDVRDFNSLKKAIAGIDYVYHLAALPRIQRSMSDPLMTSEVNIQGTLNVLEASRQMKVKNVIFSSSSSIYGKQNRFPLTEDMSPHPLSPYALQKVVGEQYCRLYSDLYGLSTTILRLFSVYGPRQSGNEAISTVIGRFLYLKKKNKEIQIFGNGSQIRDFTYISDVIRALVSTLQLPQSRHDTYNICSGKPHSINEIAQMVGGNVAYKDERLGESPIIHGSNKKAKKILKWSPLIPIEKGIAMCL